MKCDHCGYINPNNIDTCLKCGNTIYTRNIDTSNQNANQQNANQQSYNQNNNFQNNYSTFKPRTSKNMILALILSFFITGLGQLYLGLVKRGIVCFIIGLIIGFLNAYVSYIFSIVALIWWIYVLYDTYICTNAINNNQAIPRFLSNYELE